METQRQYTRFITEAIVIFKLEGEVPHSIKADLFDLSFKGISVYSPEKIEIGTEVDFELTAKLFDRPIIGRGRIRYVKAAKINNTDVFKMGIEFISIEKEAILSIINNLQRGIAISIRKKQA